MTPTSHSQTDYSRALRAKAPHVSFLQEANKALRAIASVTRRDKIEALRRATARRRSAHGRPARSDRTPAGARDRAGHRAERSGVERDPARLRHRDAGGSARHLARRKRSRPRRASAIRSCSRRCRETLTHKSDVGAVALNLATPEELGAAYDRMAGALGEHALAGMLVAPAGARRARARARAASRPRDGPHRDGGRRRRAARADQGRGVLRAAREPRQGPRHAVAHPGRAPDRRLSRRKRRATSGPSSTRSSGLDGWRSIARMSSSWSTSIRSQRLPHGGVALDALIVLRRR